MNLKRAKLEYQRQKNDAKMRDIPWRFTFERWLKWWIDNLGPDWQEKRGRHNDEFCMARYKDKGPYAPWNVECITCLKNHQLVCGENHPRAQMTNAIAEKIYFAPGKPTDIAEYFGVQKSIVLSIKNNRAWRNVTALLGGEARKDHTRAKLTKEQAREIFLSPMPAVQIAKQYRISSNIVRAIRKKLIWKKATLDLPDIDSPDIDNRLSLTDDQVIEVFYMKGNRHDIARKFKVSPITVWEIKHKRKRKKVTANL